ncbi:MAG: RNA polymerase sigma factor [Planctomycetaceae bacterium]|nr:RNA polymerase sigma factor [Planctomycetaceae bacterium]
MTVPGKTPTDAELIDAINAGDSEAFTDLYHRYRDWVLNLAWRFTGHRDDALDVLQETFAYLAGKFPEFVLTARMTTFLYPAVRHLSIAANKKRRRSTGAAVTDDVLMTDEATSETDRDELTIALASLSDAHREILLMRFVDNMTQPEIAAALDIPVGTVKSRLHHAIECLKRLPQIEEFLSDE